MCMMHFHANVWVSQKHPIWNSFLVLAKSTNFYFGKITQYQNLADWNFSKILQMHHITPEKS